MTDFINMYRPAYRARQAREAAQLAYEDSSLSWGDIGAGIAGAFSMHNQVGAAVRAASRGNIASDIEDDPDFKISKEEYGHLSMQYSEDELADLVKSKSKAEFDQRALWIKEDKQTLQNIGNLGLVGGFLSTAAAGMLDPVAIGIGFATGGYGVAARSAQFAGKFKTFAMAGSAVAAENMAAEAFLRSTTTQKDEYSLMMAGAGGFFFGGVLGTAYRNKKFRQVRAVEMVDEAIKLEAELRALEAWERAAERAANHKPIVLKYETDSGIAEWKDTKILELKTEADFKPKMTQRERNALKKKVKARREQLNLHRQELEKMEGAGTPLKILRGAATRTKKNILPSERKRQIELELERRKSGKVDETESVDPELAKLTKPQLRNLLKKHDNAVNAKYKVTLGERRRYVEKQIEAEEADLDSVVEDYKADEARTKARTASLAEIKRIENMTDLEVAQEIRKTNPNYQATRIRALSEAEIAEEHLQATKAKERKLEAESESKSKPKSESEPEPESKPESKPKDEGEEEAPAELSEEDKEIKEVIGDANMARRVAEKIVEVTKDAANYTKEHVNLAALGVFAPVANRLIFSQSQTLRGIAIRAFNFGQGGSASRSVDASSEIHRAKMEARLGGAIQFGYEEFLREQGVGQLAGAMSTLLEKQYHRSVIKQISRPDPNAPQSVKLAANAWKRMTDYGFDKAVSVGEQGFKEGKRLENYFTTLMKDKAIVGYVNDARVGRSVVADVLAQAYHLGAKKIPLDQARILAEKIIDIQIAKYHTGTGAVTRVATPDAKGVRKLLKGSGLDDEEIEGFINSMDTDLSQASMSDRAKASLGADLSVEVRLPDGTMFGMVDLIEDDISKVANAYISERAAGISWAQAGFKSRHDLNEFLTQTEIIGTKANPENAVQLKKDVELMRQAIAAQFGEVLPDDLKGSMRAAARRTRQFSNLIAGGKLGLSSMPDLYRSLVNHGLKNAWDAFKGMKLFASREFREAMARGDGYKNPVWKEINFLMGYRGFDDSLRAITRNIDFSEGASEGLGAVIDAGLAKGIRVNNLLSGLRPVQRFIDNMSVGAAYQDLSKRLITGKIDDYLLNIMGWDRATFDRMSNLAKKHQGVASFEGDNFRVLNAEMMDGDSQELIGIAISRLHNRNTTRASVGEAPLMVNKEYGKFLLMFRQFTLASIEKQVIHDVRAGGMHTAKLLSASIVASYMTYAIKSIVEAGGEDNPSSYYESAMSGKNLVFGVMANMGQAAILGQGGDLLASVGMIPDDWYMGTGREGFRPITGLGNITPSTAGIERGLRNTRSLIEALSSGDSDDVQKAVIRNIPFLRTTAGAAGMAVLGGVLD